MKAIDTTSAAVSSKETSRITLQDQQLSQDSCRCQVKIGAQATKISAMRLELNKTLEENQKLKKYFQPRPVSRSHDQSSQYDDHE